MNFWSAIRLNSNFFSHCGKRGVALTLEGLFDPPLFIHSLAAIISDIMALLKSFMFGMLADGVRGAFEVQLALV
jgi:hypothetical protein